MALQVKAKATNEDCKIEGCSETKEQAKYDLEDKAGLHTVMCEIHFVDQQHRGAIVVVDEFD